MYGPYGSETSRSHQVLGQIDTVNGAAVAPSPKYGLPQDCDEISAVDDGHLPARGTGTMVFTALLVRLWGGEWRAQLLALLCLALAPAHLRIAAMLDSTARCSGLPPLRTMA